MENNPIIIIDDDDEDLELVSEAFKELQVKNEVLCYKNGNDALHFLRNSKLQPLFILCDVNMNTVSGFELREILHKDDRLRIKSIPFLFLSTTGNRKEILNAYSLSVQGYFRKPGNYLEIVSLLRCIVEYWGCCQHPNTQGLREE